MGRYTAGGIGRDVVAGALAGAAAVWLIDKMDWSLTHSGTKAATGAAADEMDPAHTIAAKAADKVGADIGDRRNNPVGHTVHYGIGIGIGALYGLLRGMAPSVTTGRGAIYGFATYILGDEVGVPALGLSKGPFHYPARDHAKGALAHTVFGIFTDLGTRLLSPWRNEVVILHGPSIGERLETGRHALEDGRDYLYDRGRDYLGQGREYLEDARSRIPDIDVSDLTERGRNRVQGFIDALRSRLPDADELSDMAETGRKRAAGYADSVRSRLPDSDDLADLADRGRKQARGYAKTVRSRLPDADDISDVADRSRKRARGFAKDIGSQLPDRDDVADLAQTGRKRANRFTGRVSSQLPDRDDVADLAERGRNRVSELADEAKEYGNSAISRVIRFLFG